MNKKPADNETENQDLNKQSHQVEAAQQTDSPEQPKLELASREALEASLHESEEQLNALRDQLLRAQAEAQNMQKRYEKKIGEAEKYAVQGFAKELLGVIDTFERALVEHEKEAGPLLEGIQRTHALFLSAFAKFGLKPIEPQGELFAPEWHEAISTVPAESDAQINKVIEVLQKGYILNDRLIRPALVVVAKKA